MQHAARYRGAEPYRHRRVITPSLFVLDTLGYVKPVELSMHQLPQTAVELPCTTDYTSCRIQHSLQLVGTQVLQRHRQSDRQTDRQTKYTNVLFGLSILTTVVVFSFQSSMTRIDKRRNTWNSRNKSTLCFNNSLLKHAGQDSLIIYAVDKNKVNTNRKSFHRNHKTVDRVKCDSQYKSKCQSPSM